MSIPFNGYDFLFKIVLIGDSGVGKTNILSKVTRNEFNTDSKATIGVEFATKMFNINNSLIKAQIWDTAGQERYRAITSAYYRGTSGAMIVYDITRGTTFDNAVKHWLPQLIENSDDISIILIGNKSDLDDVREVSKEVATKRASENKLLFMETSALTGDNIRLGFEELLKFAYKKQQLLKKSINKPAEVIKGRPLDKIGSEKKRKCC